MLNIGFGFPNELAITFECSFLKFWFIYANRSALGMENYGYIRKVIDRDFNTFFGKELKTLFEATLIKFKQFNRLSGYWDSKADNEIDIVAIAI